MPGIFRVSGPRFPLCASLIGAGGLVVIPHTPQIPPELKSRIIIRQPLQVLSFSESSAGSAASDIEIPAETCMGLPGRTYVLPRDSSECLPRFEVGQRRHARIAACYVQNATARAHDRDTVQWQQTPSELRSLGSCAPGRANARATSDNDSDSVVDEEIPPHSPNPTMRIPDLFTQYPIVRDALVTPTSQAQDETVEACLPFLRGESDKVTTYNEHGVASLNRETHLPFLRQWLGRLPGRLMGFDAGRPWFFYWCLAALTLLGEDVTQYRADLVETVRFLQNPEGGFGGGFGHLSHLATTYAAVLALALVGGEEAYDVIDRKAMWRWLGRLKQPDGGFQVCLGGEEDIRGAYCAAVIITLLRLPLELTPESPAYKEDGSVNLLTGVADYVRSCQTYEGGISGQPNAEAHGAYAFCALGCLAILDHPARSIAKYLDVPRLISWLSSRQYAPEGGFSGRTNKLVDGCYSHWVGGCFPLIEACLNGSDKLPAADEPSLFSREGLIRYILTCGQDHSRMGGMRDKPGKFPDAYHTCYVLNGLSAAQHQWELDPPATTTTTTAAEEGGNDMAADTAALAEAAAEAVWAVLPYLGEEGPQIFDHKDRVRPIHPVYTIPTRCVKAMRDYYGTVEGF
ncbi:hypothetical protein VTJ49DRAFT_3706 [Mycothermus thermophilus]|uniref:Protein farnesyltransferase subunit beta n=1 Tax=Humicola insolens TaxID=85995 RepID=A0ABR3VM02_HUMIN